MALPVVKTALDCSDWSRTVTPFLHQLRPLPGLVFEAATNPAALKQIYLDTNPLISAFAVSIALSPIFLLVSEINKNYSQVDRLWSILPSLYNAHYVIYAHLMGFETKRLDTLLAASCIWSVSAYIRTKFLTLADLSSNTGSPDLQLLAQRRIHDWQRRLSMGNCSQQDLANPLLPVQYCVHLFRPEHTAPLNNNSNLPHASCLSPRLGFREPRRTLERG
jgi:hypothetical protein